MFVNVINLENAKKINGTFTQINLSCKQTFSRSIISYKIGNGKSIFLCIYITSTLRGLYWCYMRHGLLILLVFPWTSSSLQSSLACFGIGHMKNLQHYSVSFIQLFLEEVKIDPSGFPQDQEIITLGLVGGG